MPIVTDSQLPTCSLSRRDLVSAGLTAGAAGAALAGCGRGGKKHQASREEARLRRRAARDTATLIAAYDATIAAHSPLAGKLGPLRADLLKHLEAFGGGPVASSSPAPRPKVPVQEKAARRALADAEQRLVEVHTRDLLHAPPELARLLASVAASGAGHVLLLRS